MTSEPDASFRPIRVVAIAAVILAPAVLISILLSKYYIPIPYKDDWTLASLIAADSVSIRALFHQHNEHICATSKLVLSLLGRATGWNLRLEPVVNVFIVLASAIALSALARTRRSRSPVPLLVAGFGASVFLFSPAQYDVFLWPWMLTATITTCLLCLAAHALGSGGRTGFHWSIVWCMLASISSAQGLFTWFALLPAAVWNTDRRRIDRARLAVWSLFSLAMWILFFVTFETSGAKSTLASNISRPWSMIEFILAVIGGPWIKDPSIAVLFGAVQLILFAWVFRLATKDGQHTRALALGGVAVWAILFGAASAAGRLQYGMDIAVTSRYLASSAALPASLFVLVAIVAEGRRRRMLLIGLVSVVAASITLMAATASSTRGWKLASLDRVRGATCIGMLDETMGLTNDCVAIIAPLGKRNIDEIDAVEHAGIRTFRRAQQVPVDPDGPWLGLIAKRRRPLSDGRVEIGGLLVDDRTIRNPGLVFLDAGRGALWCCGFSNPLEPAPSPTGREGLNLVTWRAAVPRELIDDGAGIVAFGFLPDPDRLVPLEGILEPDPSGAAETVYSGSQTEGP